MYSTALRRFRDEVAAAVTENKRNTLETIQEKLKTKSKTTHWNDFRNPVKVANWHFVRAAAWLAGFLWLSTSVREEIYGISRVQPRHLIHRGPRKVIIRSLERSRMSACSWSEEYVSPTAAALLGWWSAPFVEGDTGCVRRRFVTAVLGRRRLNRKRTVHIVD